EVLRGLVVRMAADDHAFCVNHDRLAESALANRCSHGLYGVAVEARVLLVCANVSDWSLADFEHLCLLAGGDVDRELANAPSWPVFARVGEGRQSGRSLRPVGPGATRANVAARVVKRRGHPGRQNRTGQAQQTLSIPPTVPAAISGRPR